MGLISTIKSILGLGASDRRTREDTTVTVEHEPSVESERAVKGPESGEPAEGEPEGGEQAPPESGASDEPVDSIKGIGPAYAERLGAAGVETVGDLLAADPADLAERTDISETRIEGWVDRAREA